MAISFVASGTTAGGNFSPQTPDWPTGLAAGDYVICVAAIKTGAYSIITPTGFTSLGSQSGGLGTDGVSDEGTIKLYAFGKVADGSESGTFNVSASGGLVNVMWARTAAFRNATGVWSVASGAVATDASAGTGVSFTYDTDPGFVANDWGITCWAVNSSAYTVSTHALTASGLSSITSTSRINTTTLSGARMRGGLATHAIGSGTSSGVATYTHTASGSNAVAPTGASVLIRLRESGTTTLTADTVAYTTTGVAATFQTVLNAQTADYLTTINAASLESSTGAGGYRPQLDKRRRSAAALFYNRMMT